MERHFVTFLSPGTFTAEETTRPIDEWDTGLAMQMARTIKKRHGAIPYGFYFTTRSRTDDELDSKVTRKSNLYYLGVTVKTLADVKNETDWDNRILIKNMKINGYERIIVNDNSWRWTQPLREGDVVLDFKA